MSHIYHMPTLRFQVLLLNKLSFSAVAGLTKCNLEQ